MLSLYVVGTTLRSAKKCFKNFFGFHCDVPQGPLSLYHVMYVNEFILKSTKKSLKFKKITKVVIFGCD